MLLASLLGAPATARADDAPWPGVQITMRAPITRPFDGVPTLEAHASTGWSAVPCSIPCYTQLDPALEYRISGPGVADSDSFALPRGADPVHLDVTPAGSGAHAFVTGLAVFGLLPVVVGTVTLFLPNDSTATTQAKTVKYAAGIGLVVGGALFTGMAMWLMHLAQTTVRVSPAPQKAALAR